MRRLAAVVGRSILAGLGAAALLALPAPHGEAAVTPGRVGWVYFVAEGPDGDSAISRSNFDGSVVQQLTEVAPILRTPSVSPDGTRVAYTRTEGLNGDIWVMEADGSNPQRITTSQANDYAPAWSPDGTRIYFTSNRDGDAHVFVMRADGTRPRNLTSALGHGHSPVPSPDGRSVAFTSIAGGGGDIWVMDADGGEYRNLTGTPTVSDRDPTWSPDGRTIAFTRQDAGSDLLRSHVFLMDADGTDARQLTTGEANDYLPTFTPDGRTVAFSTNEGRGTVSRIGVDGTGRAKIADAHLQSAPDWGGLVTLCQGEAATIAGTPGNDVLRGTPGPDVIAGLGGNDTLIGFDGADTFCGGAGVDTVGYSGHEGRVTADLTGGLGDDGSPEDGPAGSRDSIGKDVENLTGGWGDDTLTGSSAANRLDGGVGDDVLRGGHGRDALYGGAGRDSLLAVDDLRDTRVDCGAGTDAAARRDRLDPRAVSC